jgi:hypothetical protein
MTSISLDGITITGYEFDSSTPFYQANGLEPSSWHALRIKNVTDYGRLECITDAVQQETPIPDMPAKASNDPPYILIGLGILGLLVLRTIL